MANTENYEGRHRSAQRRPKTGSYHQALHSNEVPRRVIERVESERQRNS